MKSKAYFDLPYCSNKHLRISTGNSWGVDPQTGEGCVGCGPQEQFYACADVNIRPRNPSAARPAPPETASALRPTATRPNPIAAQNEVNPRRHRQQGRGSRVDPEVLGCE